MVKAWREKVVIPTYEVGKPEKNPIFLEKRVYQGSSGVVYPYPVIESMSDEKVDKEYEAIFIENEYLSPEPSAGGKRRRWPPPSTDGGTARGRRRPLPAPAAAPRTARHERHVFP